MAFDMSPIYYAVGYFIQGRKAPQGASETQSIGEALDMLIGNINVICSGKLSSEQFAYINEELRDVLFDSLLTQSRATYEIFSYQFFIERL